jgi:hypothetical protein
MGEVLKRKTPELPNSIGVIYERRDTWECRDLIQSKVTSKELRSEGLKSPEG